MYKHFVFIKKNSIIVNFYLNDQVVQRSNMVLILILIQNYPLVTIYIDFIKKKAFEKLGLLKHTCRDFQDDTSLKLLYYSIVCSKLEYGFLIWQLNSLSQLHRLSKIQNHFLKFLSLKCHIERIPHSKYTGVERFFNLPKIKVDTYYYLIKMN